MERGRGDGEKQRKEREEKRKERRKGGREGGRKAGRRKEKGRTESEEGQCFLTLCHLSDHPL